MSLPIISVEKLSKRYLVGHRREPHGSYHSYTALRDILGQELRNFTRKTVDVVRGRQVLQGDTFEEFWALRDMSFDVHEGEVLGIIGRNGAGKSTLLKILSRITEPTAGRITLRGRVASLLEVGTGFHPELSGRENIYLNGSILGMSRANIRKKFDEIVAFAEIERFVDTPVKRYSSGMYVRLAFGVAAHLEPEILIVDEVLAVGDAEFQKKCVGKMGEVSRRDGRTVLFVSHNMVAVQSLCKRALLLSNGRLIDDGPAAAVISNYLKSIREFTKNGHWEDKITAPGTSTVRIKDISVVPADPTSHILTMQSMLQIEIGYWVLDSGTPSHITYVLVNENEIVVFTSWNPIENAPGCYCATCEIPGNFLNSGAYYLNLLIVENGNSVAYEHKQITSFTIEDVAERKTSWFGKEPGVVQPRLSWTSVRCSDD